MKPRVVILSSLLICAAANGSQPPDHPGEAVLLDGLGDHHHAVSTKNAEAQRFFDQGLRLIYAFNHDEARRAFERAAELDPELAMAQWGIALSVGPNYNADADAQQLHTAYAAIQKALKLSAKAPAHEQAYIKALARRYADEPKIDPKRLGKSEKSDLAQRRKKLALDYKNAMGQLAKRYPDDLDAATLYAESAMNLRPWELWGHEGKPAEGTQEILAVLEAVLRRNPDHIGANHYYIHAVEASLEPERGLPSAHRLGGLAPAAGHLVHMPAHIFLRVGDYAAAATANEKAIAADRAYLHKFKVQGIYPMMYYSHNMHFLAVAQAMQGRFKDAKKAADDLVAHVGRHVKDMPMLEGFMPTPTLILVRFGRWDDILALPAPPEKQLVARSIHHFARGLALDARGKIDDAEKELEAVRELWKSISPDAKYGERNPARQVLLIPQALLAARVRAARGDVKAALDIYRHAVQTEDALNYMEPADWYIPVREMLGGFLLRAKRPAEAEKVFRADLERNRRSGRSLFGLRESLKAQEKAYDAQLVGQQFHAAWRNADVELRLEDF